ncbi:SpoIIE family protein phosphatase [Virgisporangium ochraceum]|nr:SpoIIE family protein phosphatase [Virgisporangium ochraceum]
MQRTGDPATIMEAFENAAPVLVLFEGPELVIRAANAACRKLYRREDVVGLPVREAVPAIVGQEIFEVLDRVWVEERPFLAVEWQTTFDRSDPDSEVFLTFSLVPMRHPDGTMRGIVAHAVDHTDDVLARRAAQARLAGAEQRAEAAEQVLFTLQRHLLPDVLPVLPQVRLAARYRVAEAELQAGGDWFGAVPLGHGRVALVVGDVVGHGAEAAAAMARLQTVLHEALLQPDVDIADAVARLDAYAARTPTTRAATVCVAVLDPADRTLTYLSRAHPAPLVCGADGRTRYLPATPGAPLGVRGTAPAPSTVRLDAGDLVLLYTDGLVERPGETLHDGQSRLARVAATALDTGGRIAPRSLPDRLTTLAVERITRVGYHDDVTALAAHLLPAPQQPLILDLRADPAELATVREAVTAWIGPLGLRDTDATAVMLAACEAATNVVVHAYADGVPGRLGVVVDLDATGTIRMTVDDDGRWRPPTGTSGGRGIGLMRTVCDEVVIDSGAHGTRVTLCLTPGHPTVLAQDNGRAYDATPAPHAFSAIRTDEPGQRPRLAVHGSLDATTTPLLHAAVQHHNSEPLVLDLSAVSLLASAGVQLLHRLTGELPIELWAPPGTNARHILDLTDLSARTLP